jgi:hypothetical protein
MATSIAVIGLLQGQNRTFDLLTASVTDIQAAVGSGKLTYEQLIRLYLNRIDAYDKHGPRLNAVIEINRRAIEIARALDEERRTKGLRSSLHGIPIAVKDNIDVSDIPSAGGSLAFAEHIPLTTPRSFSNSVRPAPSFSSRPTWTSWHWVRVGLVLWADKFSTPTT